MPFLGFQNNMGDSSRRLPDEADIAQGTHLGWIGEWTPFSLGDDRWVDQYISKGVQACLIPPPLVFRGLIGQSMYKAIQG